MNDPFALLDLPRRFDLPPDAVQAAWLARASLAHPDVAGAEAGEDEGETARQAALLNDARRVLADDEQRANALLALLGGPSKEDDTTLAPEFLMRILEVREELEEAQRSSDTAGVDASRAWARTERENYRAHVGELFEALNESPDPDVLRNVRHTLNEWRYIERMIEQAVERTE